MKIDRLIGIITILQQNEKVTAPYLAEKFEVSRRTINRDIEDICRAGIPIVTTQGTNGGISLMEGFALDTTVFTQQELSAVFTGLKTLDSVSFSQSASKLAQKMGAKDAIGLTDHMTIDLASFYKSTLSSKIELIKKGISERKCLSFHYYYNKGEVDKLIEPYRIYFMWSDWYVFGYCKQRQDFRLYKLRRLWDLQLSEEGYEVRAIPDKKLQFHVSIWRGNMIKTLIINGSPRINGDTASLLDVVKENIEGEYRVVDVYRCAISPCLDCRFCWKNNGCAINDEMQEIYDYIQICDNILIASPIYFSELTGRLLDVGSR